MRKSDDLKPFMEAPRWNKNFQAFGHRLNFLSPERQHLATGHLRILPARDPKKER